MSLSPLIVIAENKENLSKLIDTFMGKRTLIVINNKKDDYSLSLYLRELEVQGIDVFTPSEPVDLNKASNLIISAYKDKGLTSMDVIYDYQHDIAEKLPIPKPSEVVVIKDFPYPFTDEQRNVKGIKLHLGCANIYLNDFINIDMEEPIADENMDASKLKKYKDNSVSLIMASHIIEHFDWRQHENILKEWYRVLMPNCWLIVEAPNLEEAFKNFLDEKDDNNRLYENFPQIFGRPDFSVGNIHQSGVWPSYLKNVLKKVGFKKLVTMPPVRNRIECRCLRIDAQK
jgi:SAM-dependent methyltransferase